MSFRLINTSFKVTGPFIINKRPSETVVAQFNFNNTAQSVTDWTDVSGNPNTAIRTATYPGTGVGVTSVATARWSPFGNTSTNTGGETTANPTFIFPSTVVASYWFTYQNILTGANPNLKLTGLSTSGIYTIQILGSRDDASVPLAQRLMYAICVDNVGTETSSNFNVKANTANVITFSSKIPTSAGEIDLVINPVDFVNNQFGYLNGLKVLKLN